MEQDQIIFIAYGCIPLKLAQKGQGINQGYTMSRSHHGQITNYNFLSILNVFSFFMPMVAFDGKAFFSES